MLSLYHRASERPQTLFPLARQSIRSRGEHSRSIAQCISLRRYRSSVIEHSLYSLQLPQMLSIVRWILKRTHRNISTLETSSRDLLISTLNHRRTEKDAALASCRAWTTVRTLESSHHICTLLTENYLSTRTIPSRTCKRLSDREGAIGFVDTSASRPNCVNHLQTWENQ